MTNKIKFAVVGYGNIGKRHAHHIQNSAHAELVAVCDINEQLKTKIAVPFYKDLEAMLQNIQADVINVCTPNYLHAPHTILALNNKYNVVCEKPMAINTTQCNEMIAAAEANQKTIFVVKQNRYNPPVQQVKKLIQENKLGKIYFVNINCFWNRNEQYYAESTWRGTKEKDGGCLFTQFSHFVDILYYLFGNVEVAKSIFKNYNHAYTNVEDTGSSLMYTNSGAMVNFNFSTCSYNKNMEGAITILAENGTIKIGGQYLNTIEFQHIKNIELPAINIVEKHNEYGFYQGSMSNHDEVIKNVVETLNGTASIMTNAHEGAAVVKIIEEMYKG